MGPDIFVSYAREDEERIRKLVSALEQRGWSVFWDHRIPAGQSWRSYIGQALDDARCAIVAWSRASVASEFVVEEAVRARRRGILVPVRLDPVDPPLGFGELNAADLCGWQPGTESAAFEQLAQDLAAVLARAPAPARAAPVDAASTPASAPAPPAPPAPRAEPQPPRPSRRWVYASIAVAAMAIAISAAVLFRRPAPPGPTPSRPTATRPTEPAGLSSEPGATVPERSATTPLRVTAEAIPASVASGRRTVIAVNVEDPAGRPVAGATVTVSAGGGKFLRVNEGVVPSAVMQGPYSAEGRTAASGRYETAWACNPCAPGYRFSVKAEHPGFAAGSADVTVRVSR